jgi:hypothetical protein
MQGLRSRKAEMLRIANLRRPLRLLKAGMSGLRAFLALARGKKGERARAHEFWRRQALSKAFHAIQQYPDYRKEERRLQEVARAQRTKQVRNRGANLFVLRFEATFSMRGKGSHKQTVMEVSRDLTSVLQGNRTAALVLQKSRRISY